MSRYDADPAQYTVDHQQPYIATPVGLRQPPSEPQAAHTRRELYDHETGLAQHAFDYNQRAIPGLGIGARSLHDGTSNWAHPDQTAVSFRATRGFARDFEERSNSMGAPSGEPAKDITMDASLSDGELEDIYEPTAEEDPVQLPLQRLEVTDDRLMSYSPQLSTPDVDQNHHGPLPEDTVASVPYGHASDMNGNRGVAVSGKALSDNGQLLKARGDARDAIMRLWPLNVRYENYLQDGVDKSLLQTLFQELGLALEPPAVERPKAGAEGFVEIEKGPKPASGTLDSGDDNTESRKDRIARLLAAKRTRQQTAPPAPLPAEPMTHKKPQQTPKKAIDKSKLLYEKMEALRRAREAKAQEAAQGKQPNDDLRQPGQRGSSPGEGRAESRVDTQPSSVDVHQEVQYPAASQSSSPQQIPRIITQKRPIASDFLTQQQEPAPKRPFSQTDRSRRFLIDVSDDDDSDHDTAMDLDSPEMRPLALRRNATEDSVLRNHPPLTEIPSNGRSTPNFGPGRSNSNHGKDDLNRMQQDIEEMKRRIAEAEARKMAKQSRQGTPHQSPSHEKSESSTSSPASAAVIKPTSDSAMATAASLDSSDVGPSPRASPVIKPHSGQGPPELRRSLSRAALDRLAVIEADRKRQTLKMKILRAQLAQMEREMAASLEEEKTLREEAESSDADHEVSSASNVDSACPKPDHPVIRPSAPSALPSEQPQAIPTSTENPLHETTMESSAESGAASSLEEQAHHDQDKDMMPDVTPPEMPVKQMSVAAGTASRQSDLDTSDAGTHQEELTTLNDTNGNRSGADTPPQSVDMVSAESDSDDEASETSDASGEASPGITRSPSAAPHPSKTEVERDHTLRVDASDEEDGATPGSHHSASLSIASRMDVMDDSNPEQGNRGDITAEDQLLAEATNPNNAANGETFQPYESPLQYFHAYRFHPEFSKSVKGGLRSLTYSNKLDVRQQLCPEELLGQECPRGDECDFQHLAKVATPDDQILMQLGSYGAHEGDRQEEFNKGLRKLLSDLRDKKIKDFQAISQAIIDYRAQFHQDRSRILPLGNVSL